ncbi:hypothetical protein MKZ38_007288 [Zalerion maritima]|uniref:Uncharacterized protein n=1 Tax=Zalerion maritima TaxID=339359 RepID=A0AAD5RHX6_9PEZI|nr:hypothetical protein MKZ38_007288 [Zalerion maritima]
MPSVKSYTPAWLACSPGADLFKPSLDQPRRSAISVSSASRTKARRTIARRGTEAYIAVGREIRWVDLVYLRDSWVSQNRRGRTFKQEDSESSLQMIDEDDLHSSLGGAQGYRTLKTPLGLEIEALVMSPQENYLAVVTRHTVHICMLPNSSHLTAADTEPLKPKFYQLGPTLHVTSKSAVSTAIFHPLGVNGCTLVTVTEDANVRIWEFNPSDRWTFDQPTVSIDLKKLADGTSLDQDFSASTAGANSSFSPDALEMQVASACFPARGSGGWSAMTLWVCMTEGDVYALSPLLPNKWAPPPTLIPSLSVSIVSNLAAIEDDPEVSPQAKQLAQQQLEWMADLDSQDPQLTESMLGEPPTEIYKRPARPGATPKLQGPFEIDLAPDSDDDLDIQLTDIFVIGQKLEVDELMLGEDDDLEMDDIDREGLSLSVVCLLSTSGQLRICIDMEGVEAQWLPPPKKSKAAQLLHNEYEEHTLVTFQTLGILNQSEAFEEGWPMFSPDVLSRYAFYITHASSITYISLAPWVFRLATELDGESAPGAEFRIDLLANGQNSQRERLYAREISDASISMAATVAIRDPDLGYFLLSATQHEPVCVVLESPDEGNFHLTPPDTESDSTELDRKPIEWHEPRPTFMPSYAFQQPSSLPAWLDQLKTSKHRMLVNQEVRLSPATLGLFTEAHRIMSEETSRICAAAAELFRKADSLQREFQAQIAKSKELADRVEEIVADDEDEENSMSSNDRIETRILAAQERQKMLADRLESLKKKVSRAGSRPLSDKERQFVNEISNMHTGIVADDEKMIGSGKELVAGSNTNGLGSSINSRIKTPRQRFVEAQSLKEDLTSQAEELKKATAGGNDGGSAPSSPAPSLRIPADVRKAKLAQVRSLLDRETALVEGVKSRLERLSVG